MAHKDIPGTLCTTKKGHSPRMSPVSARNNTHVARLFYEIQTSKESSWHPLCYFIKEMKNLCVIIFLLCQISSLGAAIEQDKLLHATTSYGISYTCSKLSELPVFCAVGTLLLGVGKEYFIDKRPDEKDILWDGIGVGASMVIYQF